MPAGTVAGPVGCVPVPATGVCATPEPVLEALLLGLRARVMRCLRWTTTVGTAVALSSVLVGAAGAGVLAGAGVVAGGALEVLEGAAAVEVLVTG